MEKTQRRIEKIVKAKEKYPEGIVLAIHHFDIEQLLKICKDEEGVIFHIPSACLQEFLEKIRQSTDITTGTTDGKIVGDVSLS